MKRTSSTTSIGFPDTVKSIDKTNEKSSTDKEKSVSVKLHEEVEATDLCQVLIFCENHRKICLTPLKSKRYWLPWMVITSNDSLTYNYNELLNKIGVFSDAYRKTPMALINVFRLQPTPNSSFLTRHTFFTRIVRGSLSPKCCENIEKMKWIEVTKAIKLKFWGPEVATWVRYWILNANVKVKKIIEYDKNDALIDYCQQPAFCIRKEQIILKSAVFIEKDILRLFESYCHHCYPSQFMSFCSFKLFVRHVDIRVPESLLKTFQAFDCRRRDYLTFNELLLGFAAIDQATEHGGQAGLLRCEYIFRYYNNKKDSFLTMSEICQMIKDIKHKSETHHIKGPVEAHAQRLIQLYGTNNRLSIEGFIQAVSDLKFRGTSVLFRASGPTLSKHSFDRRSNGLLSALIRQNNYDISCEVCHKRKYKLSRNLYHMHRNGEILNFSDLKKHFPDIGESQLRSDLVDTETYELAKDIVNRVIKLYLRRYSTTQTNVYPRANTLEAEEMAKNWWYSSKGILNKKLLLLCRKAKELFQREDRVLSVSTPCYMFGDIHGNLKDLIIFSMGFWRTSPFLNECNYLFLGDYVDRGLYGVECVSYLFAMKLLAPKKFWLCRGNHEIRSLQEMFTFFNECVTNYSEKVWTSFNEVFDRLPIAAVVDNRIFGCHGGIPKSVNSVEDLMKVPKVMEDPQAENPEAWEVLWNDPMPDDEFRALSLFERQEAQNLSGFLGNLKRGTAYYYTEIAVDRFLEHNDLQFVVRGHECVDRGYKFMMNGRVTTIFSTSLYCGLRNEAAVMFVNYGKLRVIPVTTFEKMAIEQVG